LLLLASAVACAQDLVPRAYLITPAGSNAVTMGYSWNKGDVVFDPSVPIDDARGTFQTPVISLYHSYAVLGRSSNIVVSVPYGTGRFEGVVNKARAQASPSGLADARIRFSVNLHGGPVMRPAEYLRWREKWLVGFSFTTVIPIGQYDGARLINTGANRWAFKPEIGITRRWHKWVAEAYTGLWLFTTNPHFFPGDTVRSQRPMTALEGHVGYYIRPRLWISLDGNFWVGGSTSANGTKKQDGQKASRAGVTMSVPLTRHHSFKLGYSQGAFRRLGGDFRTISAAWQYSWIGKPQ
jgi:hypothetical protein